tara:strand:- start:56 stop:235 length:180 start_codon:yes stop_codon:yes gene_type:complete
MLLDLMCRYDIPATCYLSFLQEYGIISDLCVEASEVVNDMEATHFILGHWREFKADVIY